jgi:hypothetical protein
LTVHTILGAWRKFQIMVKKLLSGHAGAARWLLIPFSETAKVRHV